MRLLALLVLLCCLGARGHARAPEWGAVSGTLEPVREDRLASNGVVNGSDAAPRLTGGDDGGVPQPPAAPAAAGGGGGGEETPAPEADPGDGDVPQPSAAPAAAGGGGGGEETPAPEADPGVGDVPQPSAAPAAAGGGGGGEETPAPEADPMARNDAALGSVNTCYVDGQCTEHQCRTENAGVCCFDEAQNKAMCLGDGKCPENMKHVCTDPGPVMLKVNLISLKVIDAQEYGHDEVRLAIRPYKKPEVVLNKNMKEGQVWQIGQSGLDGPVSLDITEVDPLNNDEVSENFVIGEPTGGTKTARFGSGYTWELTYSCERPGRVQVTDGWIDYLNDDLFVKANTDKPYIVWTEMPNGAVVGSVLNRLGGGASKDYYNFKSITYSPEALKKAGLMPVMEADTKPVTYTNAEGRQVTKQGIVVDPKNHNVPKMAEVEALRGKAVHKGGGYYEWKSYGHMTGKYKAPEYKDPKNWNQPDAKPDKPLRAGGQKMKAVEFQIGGKIDRNGNLMITHMNAKPIDAPPAGARLRKFKTAFARTFKYASRGFFVLGLAQSALAIYHAEDKVKAVVQEAATMAGGAAGARVGFRAGMSLPIPHPIGKAAAVAVCTIGGAVIGAFGAEKAITVAYEVTITALNYQMTPR